MHAVAVHLYVVDEGGSACPWHACSRAVHAWPTPYTACLPLSVHPTLAVLLKRQRFETPWVQDEGPPGVSALPQRC